MTKENLINLVNNKKPFETVYELKNETRSVVGDQIPTYEEFMKTYENDGNLNYDDLKGGSVGEVKGYGPCSSCSGSNRNLKFKLDITLKNCVGDAKGCTVYNTSSAREQAKKILAETGHWTDGFLSGFSQEARGKLYDRIKEKIDYHKRGNEVDTSVCNKEDRSYTTDGMSAEDLDDYFENREYYMYGPGSYTGGERSGRGGLED